MSNNKENNMKIHKIITKFFTDVVAKFSTILNSNGKIKSSEFDNDLTHLTTQDEYYNAMEENGVYKIKVGNYEFLTTSNVRKYPTLIEVSITINSSAVTTISQLVIRKGDTTPLSAPTSQVNVADPTKDTHAVNLKTLNGEIAKIPVIPTGYEEKEITITPAVYGWKTITEDFIKTETDHNIYIGKKLKIINEDIPNDPKMISGFIQTWDLNGQQIFWLGESLSFQGITITLAWSKVTPDRIKGDINGDIDLPVNKVEIWDIITPAVKATVLVKK